MSNVFQQGVIASVTENEVTVAIRCKSSCLHCQVKNNCAMADTRLKNITVQTRDAFRWKPGQKVTLVMDERLGWLAVLFCYILPLLLVLGVLLASLASFADETWAAFLSLSILLPYYLLLAVFRKRFSNLFCFQIIPE